MKKLFVLATLILAAPLARASDLSRDRLVPDQPMSNPFHGVAELPLEASVASELRALLERCANVPVSFETEDSAHVAPACADSLKLNANQDTLLVNAGSLSLTIVSWDGSHSDGGDEQAIGVYNTLGDRVAVYPSLFADGNVIDGIAHAVGAKLPHSRR